VADPKSRPILFAAPMVRAILAGQKRMTRRVVTPQPISPNRIDFLSNIVGRPAAFCETRPMSSDLVREIACPYGAPGGRLVVRENYRITSPWDGRKVPKVPVPIHYEADGPAPEAFGNLRPSIFLPRWASRLTLAVTGVRVERLHDITEADARAEGLSTVTKDGGRTWKFGISDRDGLPGTDDDGWPWTDWDRDPCKAFATLWRRINGAKSWTANPWVWVVAFERVAQSEASLREVAVPR
jgi:hypothetical protein